MSLPKLASLSTFAPESRLWVYVCDRTLTNAESGEIQEQLNWFCKQWTAHNQQLQAAAEVFKNQFVLLMVDETEQVDVPLTSRYIFWKLWGVNLMLIFLSACVSPGWTVNLITNLPMLPN